MENENNKDVNKIQDDEDLDNLLLDSYGIDNESLEDSDADKYSYLTGTIQLSSASQENEQDFLNFIQAVKDDNCEFVEEFIKQSEGNQKCNFFI